MLKENLRGPNKPIPVPQESSLGSYFGAIGAKRRKPGLWTIESITVETVTCLDLAPKPRMALRRGRTRSTRWIGSLH